MVDYVQSTLPYQSLLSVSRIASDTALRRIDFDWYGYVGVQSYDTAAPRTEHYARLTELLRVTSPHLAAGFIRESNTMGGDRTDVLSRRQPQAPLAQALQRGFWLSSHLESDYVDDAFVEQVMTISQLNKTHDLAPERWQVTDLGHNHHLVAHSRPTLWLVQEPARTADPAKQAPRSGSLSPTTSSPRPAPTSARPS